MGSLLSPLVFGFFSKSVEVKLKCSTYLLSRLMFPTVYKGYLSIFLNLIILLQKVK